MLAYTVHYRASTHPPSEIFSYALKYPSVVHPPVLTEAVSCWDGAGRCGGEVKSASSDWAASSWRIAIRGEDWEEKGQAIRLKYHHPCKHQSTGEHTNTEGGSSRSNTDNLWISNTLIRLFFNYTQAQYQKCFPIYAAQRPDLFSRMQHALRPLQFSPCQNRKGSLWVWGVF